MHSKSVVSTLRSPDVLQGDIPTEAQSPIETVVSPHIVPLVSRTHVAVVVAATQVPAGQV